MKAFRRALSNIRRAPYQVLVVIFLLFLTITVALSLIFALYGSHELLTRLEAQPQVTAFFEPGTDIAVLNEAASRLRDNAMIREVVVVNQYQALERYQAQTSQDPLLQELVTADILPPSLEVRANSLSALNEVANLLNSEKGIDEVVYQQDVIDNLSRWVSGLRQFGIGVVLVLSVASLLLIALITGLRLSSKRQEIKIMRLLGARPSQVATPFMYEGMIYGAVSAVLALLVSVSGLWYATPALNQFLGDLTFLPIELPLIGFVAGGTIFVGGLFGALASWSSALYYLRR